MSKSTCYTHCSGKKGAAQMAAAAYQSASSKAEVVTRQKFAADDHTSAEKPLKNPSKQPVQCTCLQ